MERLLFGGGGTSNDLHQFASNDSLSSAIEENLKSIDHVSSVLRGILIPVSWKELSE